MSQHSIGSLSVGVDVSKQRLDVGVVLAHGHPLLRGGGQKSVAEVHLAQQLAALAHSDRCAFEQRV